MQLSLQRKLLFILLFVGFLNLFLFHAFGSMSLVLLVVASFLFLLGIFLPYAKENSKQALGIAAALTILQLLLVNRDNWFVSFVLFGTDLVVLSLFAYLSSSRLTFVRSLLEFILIPLQLGLSYATSGLSVLQKIIEQDTSFFKQTSSGSRLTSLLVGLLIGIPIVIILVTLLSAADPIFANFTKHLFNINLGTFKVRLIFSTVWFVILLPFLLLKRKSDFVSPVSYIEKLAFTREMSVVMILVAVTLGTFLVVQAPYVFVNVPAETDLSKFGVATYSQYVTKGFFELLAVSFFIYGIIWLGLLFLRRKPKNAQQPLLTLQLVVLAEFAIFLFSIFRRVWLYQVHHGLSLTRVYGTFFLIWIAFIALTLLARHFWEKRWVKLELVVTAAFVLVFGLFNAEDFIARVNPPHVNKRIDYVYLSRMSADGVTGWQKAIDYTDDVLTKREFETKPLLNRDDRREIAYAGNILGTMTAYSHNLVYKYGTDAEWSIYMLNVYQELQTINTNQLAIRLGQASLIETQKKLIQHVSELPEHIKSRRGDITVAISFYPEQFASVGTDCTVYSNSYCNQSFYTLIDGPIHAKEKDGWDHLFTWNGASARAYQVVKNEITFAKLLALQRNYFALYNKILNQPAEEREFDVDISFDTPFLGGL